jgi:hypothetical protein
MVVLIDSKEKEHVIKEQFEKKTLTPLVDISALITLAPKPCSTHNANQPNTT